MKEFERLIDALRDPAAYDHPVAAVEVVETHISAVLLAGDYAYKIKKPVDFGFVDFTTLDKRRWFCEEELRLNRRFAPNLYLDVAVVRGDGRPPSFRSGGGPLEYAVRMRRFDTEMLLDRCIHKEGLITAAMIETFAGDVAAVHAGADVALPGDGYGTPSVIAANVRECRDPIREAGLIQGSGDLVSGMDERASALEPWFEKRLRDGHVRECHGDLHLGNLFLDNGHITAFDCIEFNPSLSWIDVANEIAFFTMDLRYHDRVGYGRRFRNAYLDATGDYSMLRVLQYYEIYRALVRAKVASLRETERAGAGVRDARRHLELAQGLMDAMISPGLLITCGLSGSGKTYLSTRLLEQGEVVRVRSDVERNRRRDDNPARYSDAGIERVYRRLLGEAGAILDAGYPVIVDATFLKRARRERFRKLAEDHGVPFGILYCTAPDHELRRRVAQRAQRGTDASEADVSVLDLQLREQEPPQGEERSVTVEFDGDVRRMEQWFRDWVNRGAGPQSGPR